VGYSAAEGAMMDPSQSKELRCPYCGQSYSRGDSLKRHITDIHENPTDKRIQCDKCFKDFKNMNKNEIP